LEDEIKVVKTINKDVNMNFELEKCSRICFKKRQIPKQNIFVGHLRRTLKKLTQENRICIYV